MNSNTEKRDILISNFNHSASVIAKVLESKELIDQILQATEVLTETIKTKNIIYSCGNGGSMADAIHFAEELSGRFQDDRPGLPAISISDPGHISCVGNDYGYEHIFSRFIESVGKKSDTLVGVSTSGNSKNVLIAMKKAKELGMKTICLLGKDGGSIKNECDLPIIVPDQTTHRIQEIHIQIIHNLIEGIERNLFPENYK